MVRYMDGPHHGRFSDAHASTSLPATRLAIHSGEQTLLIKSLRRLRAEDHLYSCNAYGALKCGVRAGGVCGGVFAANR
jgi:hypothetical protein